MSDHCDLLERDDLTNADRHHYSIVNRRALLDTLDFFSVSGILEGALPLEVKLMPYIIM